jgi:FkbM family methyltransferase
MIRRLASLLKKSPDVKNNYVRPSYSQCGEDLIVDFVFGQLGIEKPNYIDIGAHHPRYINNTFLFYQKGSRGINIEPDPALFQEFTVQRKEDTNLNIGIGEEAGEADFYIMNTPSLNTFIKSEAENIVKENSAYKISEVRKIKVRTLIDILKEFNNGSFPDFMTIDVEGLDEQIIRGINFESVVPKIMCVETLTFADNGRGVKKTDLIEFLKSKGYLAYADTHINTIFVKEKLWVR